jgi:hypothetical protein
VSVEEKLILHVKSVLHESNDQILDYECITVYQALCIHILASALRPIVFGL